MSRVRRIVVASDFSEGSAAAVARGMELAKAHGARVDLLHAFDVGSLRALRRVFDVDRLFADQPASMAARQRLSAMASELEAGHGVPVHACFGVGEPAAVLAAHVEAVEPALVVTGRRADPQDPGIGGTLMKVLRNVACPILIVRAGRPQAIQTVVSAVDLREVSRRAAMAAANLFPSAGHHLVCALDPAWEREVWRTSGLQPRLGQGIESLRTALVSGLEDIAREVRARTGSPVATELVDAAPLRAILGHAKACAADCIAVGRHGQGQLADHLMGSTTLDVIHHCGCDVLVVS